MTDWAIEGSIAERDGQWKLIGGRCLDCGALAFPRPKVCASCWSETIEPAELSAVGDLYTYTVVHIGRPGWRSPYAIGYVDLPEGVRICAPIDRNENELRVGAKVRLAAGELRRNPQGEAVFSHRFEIV